MKKFFFLLSLIFLVLFFNSFRSFAQTNVYSSNDTTITVNNWEQFTIALESNQSTGYSWSVAENQDNAQVVVLNMEYMQKPNEGKVVGAGGEEVWRFKAISSGNVKLIFYYSRSWEKETPAAKSIVFSVTIR